MRPEAKIERRKSLPLRAAAAAALLLLGGGAAAADIKVGGYAKLDLIYSDRIAGGGGSRVAEFAGGASAVPLAADAAAKYGDSNINARESRFNLTATGEQEGVKLKGFIETDFVTGEGSSYVSNSRGLRLRHAYGLATFENGAFVQGGQYWSNFQNNEQFYNTIDFNGPAGQLYARSPQLRVGWKGAGLTATASVEQSAVLSDGSVPGVQAQSPEVPLFTAKVHYAFSGMSVQAAGAYAQNRATGTRADAYAGQVGLEIPVPGLSFPVTFQADASYLDGTNRLANGDFNDAVVIDGRLKNVRTFGGYAGFTTTPWKKTTLSAYYGRREAEKNAASLAGDKLQETVHASVVQKLWGGLEAGLEYQYALRRQFDAQQGEMNRVQGAMWFYF
jgi:hypothetical protein